MLKTAVEAQSMATTPKKITLTESRCTARKQIRFLLLI